MENIRPRALLSVSDKTGLEGFAASLRDLGFEIVSTGGTARFLDQNAIPVTDVSTVTGFPEIMDGRVKTLHPKIHGGLLSVSGNVEHDLAGRTHGIVPIDLLAVTLYPFEKVTEAGAEWSKAIENIDIGGPAMIRAAAKNHDRVTVVVDPADYGDVLHELKAGSDTSRLTLRRKLAAKAYARTAAYDAAISGWLVRQLDETAPGWFAIGGRLQQSLRYGENPHQSAALYALAEKRPGVTSARQLHGKELSYNNINDTDAAIECAAEFEAGRDAACVIVKHANPSGVAVGATLLEAYRKALTCDPVSAFGGIVAFNRPLDAAAATAVVEIFTEVIVAPGIDPEAAEIIRRKKNLRLLEIAAMPDPRASGYAVKSVAGGLLVQSRDNAVADDLVPKIVTRRRPTDREMADLLFAFRVAKHVKSNAIVYAKDGATAGIGAGQMSRVDSARIAARKSADAAASAGSNLPLASGSVAASDAFFPFADGLLQIVEAGATAVIQPGGSLRDDEVIAAADAHGIAMVFAGVRHFRH